MGVNSGISSSTSSVGKKLSSTLIGSSEVEGREVCLPGIDTLLKLLNCSETSAGASAMGESRSVEESSETTWNG